MTQITPECFSLPQILARHVETGPDRLFVSMVGEPALSFAGIELSSRRIANGLRDLGVGAGDRVMVMLPNCVAYVETWFAINRLGAVTVTVNTAYRGAFLEHVATNSGARVMITATSFLPVIAASEEAMPELTTLIVLEAGANAAAEPPLRLRTVLFGTLRAASDVPIDVTVTPRDLAAIIYTSGTTGKSKGVLVAHAQMYFNAFVYVDRLGVTADDVFYSCLPLFHTNALILQTYGALVAGCRIHLAAQFSASQWLSDIRSTETTITNMIAVMNEFVARQPETPHDADNKLRLIMTAPISPITGPIFEKRFGVTMMEVYGSTEANTPIYHPRGEPRRDGSCGKLVEDWFECRIADPETDIEVPVGEIGELLVRPLVPGAFMSGYNGMPEETVKAWRGLWFHTGDAMRRDADGFHYFIDRMNDCIRRRGENISSFEVEQAIVAHEGVQEAAAIGIRLGGREMEQEVKLCVVKKPGSQLTAAELHAFCATRLPAFAVPKLIEFCEALPKTPTQKVRKSVLRDEGVTPATWIAPDTSRKKAAS
jgi:crotonobetaine/carnitine-CoA ligase